VAEINITSDLTPEGTKITLDGKTGKGKLKSAYFSLEYCMPCCCCHCSPCSCDMEPIPHIVASYTVEDKGEDGTEKCITYRVSKHGNEDPEAQDSIQMPSITEDIMMKYLSSKMLGRKKT
jgi:hypothetical protein